ncbi:hypothetical protein HNQ59_000119 [Chitinivorax tropicus]|uniref:Flagellar hook-length control protein-like C-terminal domain-containing protein n=1 Tax=Chitinivorax tropicus TaxID=714531 RepID=A0A840MJ87_9PROT|nr:flagellar hook-length control protein FliK [Chitinivorax tropicus]MBB5016857.1 hypothetical protein [Chitinivorax tropicus]
MIHNDALGQLNQLVRRVSPTLIEASQERPPVTDERIPQFIPGERIPAHVLTLLPNGRFEVLVKNQLLDMNLPGNAQPGEALDLTFIRVEPRPTFALTKDLAALMGGGAGEVRFSETAKFLGALLAKAEQSAATPATIGTQPMMESADTQPEQIAQNLQKAIAHSGVFYESHQAEWVSGQRSLQALQAEPQATLSQSVANHPTPQAVADPEKTAAAVGPKAEVPDLTRPAGPAKEATLLVPASTVAEKAPSLSGAELAPQLKQIVQQQLGVLDTRQMMWHGVAWPNQPMEWSIEEQVAAQQGGGGEEDRTWYSRMKLSLPTLGDVVIGVSLHGQNVAVNFHVAKAETGNRIRNAGTTLSHQLEAAGLRLAGSTVDIQEASDGVG